MSKSANSTLIGIFVLGGTLLLIVAVGLFGSGFFTERQHQFICFFEDSVNGLDTGSPVKFKGVTIGKVAHVLLRAKGQSENDNSIPVIIEIENRILAAQGFASQLSNHERYQVVLEKGLRARLQQQSLITGMLYVELDFHPDTIIHLRNQNHDDALQEIPTISTNLGTVMRAATQTLEQFSHINFTGLSEKVNTILAQVEDGLSELNLKEINQGITSVTTSAQTLLESEEIKLAATNLSAALQEFQTLNQKLTAQVDPLSAEINQTAQETRQTLERIQLAAENIRRATQPGSGLRLQLDDTLLQIADAARAIRNFTSFLERNPNSLVTGKAASENHPLPEKAPPTQK